MKAIESVLYYKSGVVNAIRRNPLQEMRLCNVMDAAEPFIKTATHPLYHIPSSNPTRDGTVMNPVKQQP